MEFLPKMLPAFGAVLLSLSFTQAVQAQVQMPVLDGQITPGEYGSSYTTGDQTWYMTWNNDNLYVATVGAPVNEATVMYFDTNPSLIVNDINSPGTTQGVSYDNTNGTLPFNADAVLYFKPGSQYREVRKYVAELGRWGNLKAGIGADNTNGNTIREFSIPWSEISTTGTRPPNFNWLGYISYDNAGGTGVYAPVPRANPSGAIGTNASFVRYFTTLNTAATGSNNNAFGPNGLDSYTHVGNSVSNMGAIEVYDFTLNTLSANITRRDLPEPNTTTLDWNIRGNLRVGAGLLDLGNSTASVRVAGDLTSVDDAAFNPGNASIILASNNNQNISGDTYRSLTIDGNGVRTVVDNNLIITSSLIISQGLLVTGGNQVDLGNTGSLQENQGYLQGLVRSVRNISTPGTYNFGGTGLEIISSTGQEGGTNGAVSVLRITDGFGIDASTSIPTANKTIRRRFFINGSAQEVNTTIRFTYRNGNPDELEGNSPPRLVLYKSAERVFNYSEVTGLVYDRPQQQQNRILVARGIVALQGFFSLSSANSPLPVELISFIGKGENNAVRLNWTTASEKQNKGFEVERRTDQNNWQRLGFVAGNGTTNQRNNYTYVDRSAASGNNYYRLRQIDLDGKSVYSQPITVQTGPVAFTLSPVPATDVLTLNGLGAGNHTAEIYNARGQRVLNQTFSDEAATTLTVSTLPAGVYMVRVLGSDRSVRQARFIKQ